MHTQIKSIIIFPCSILTDDPSCTILSSDSDRHAVAHVLPPMSPVSPPLPHTHTHPIQPLRLISERVGMQLRMVKWSSNARIHINYIQEKLEMVQSNNTSVSQGHTQVEL